MRHDILGWQAMKLFKRVASLEETHAMLEEARLLSTLGHPNIVRLFDAGTLPTPEGRRGFFTMEYVAGGSLERLLRSYAGTVVPLEIAVNVFEQMTSAMVLAHDQSPPILHRDLTLANALAGYDDAGLRVRLSDFGLSKRADPVTQLASAQGTFAFMAPEVQRLEGYSRASDVYSLGTIAYVLLTNNFPYKDARGSFSLARFRNPARPPSHYNDAVDPDLDRIVLAALERNPADRVPSASALAEELRHWREQPKHETRTAPPVPSRNVERRAGRLASEALVLARHPATLREAADLMEEAVTLSVRMRDRHQERLTLWRRGVMM